MTYRLSYRWPIHLLSYILIYDLSKLYVIKLSLAVEQDNIITNIK